MDVMLLQFALYNMGATPQKGMKVPCANKIICKPTNHSYRGVGAAECGKGEDLSLRLPVQAKGRGGAALPRCRRGQRDRAGLRMARARLPEIRWKRTTRLLLVSLHRCPGG
jgi:hypothetical protein